MSQVVIAPDHITIPINEEYLAVTINGTEIRIPRGTSETVPDNVCELLHWMEAQTGDMGIIYTDEVPKADKSKADYHVLQS